MGSGCYPVLVHSFTCDTDHSGNMQVFFWKVVSDSYKVLCFPSSLGSEEDLITLGIGGKDPGVEKFRSSLAGYWVRDRWR